MLTKRQLAEKKECEDSLPLIVGKLKQLMGILEMAVEEKDYETAHEVTLEMQTGLELAHISLDGLEAFRISDKLSRN